MKVFLPVTKLMVLVMCIFTCSFAFLHHNNSAEAATPWTLTSSLQGKVMSLSCPTTTLCVAVLRSAGTQDPLIERSTDSGSTWTNESVPPLVTQLNSVACPSSTQCYAVGTGYAEFSATVISSNDGGITWVQDTIPSADGLNTVSCPSSTECFSVGTTHLPGAPIMDTTNAGATWTAPNFMTSLTYGDVNLNALSCPTLNFCAFGGWIIANTITGEMNPIIYTTTNSGSSFVEATVPSGIVDVTSISCPTELLCDAIGVNYLDQPVFLTSTGPNFNFTGSILLSSVGSIQEITCVNSLDCLIVGSSTSNVPEAISSQTSGTSFSLTQVTANDSVIGDSVTCTSNLPNDCFMSSSNQLDTSSYISFSSTSFLGSTTVTTSAILPPPNPTSSIFSPVIITGDSTAYSLGSGMLADESENGIQVNLDQVIGCGIVANGPFIYHGEVDTPLSTCSAWQSDYASYVSSALPSVAMLFIGRWDTVDRYINGQYQHLGMSSYNQLFLTNLRQAIDDLSSTGARVVILTSPYYYSGGPNPTSTWPEDNPSRVDTLNRLELEAVNESHARAKIIDLGSYLSQNGSYSRVIDGIPIRTDDGVHYTTQGAIFASSYVLPKIALVALAGKYTAPGINPPIDPSPLSGSSGYTTSATSTSTTLSGNQIQLPTINNEMANSNSQDQALLTANYAFAQHKLQIQYSNKQDLLISSHLANALFTRRIPDLSYVKKLDNSSNGNANNTKVELKSSINAGENQNSTFIIIIFIASYIEAAIRVKPKIRRLAKFRFKTLLENRHLL